MNTSGLYSMGWFVVNIRVSIDGSLQEWEIKGIGIRMWIRLVRKYGRSGSDLHNIQSCRKNISTIWSGQQGFSPWLNFVVCPSDSTLTMSRSQGIEMPSWEVARLGDSTWAVRRGPPDIGWIRIHRVESWNQYCDERFEPRRDRTAFGIDSQSFWWTARSWP